MEYTNIASMTVTDMVTSAVRPGLTLPEAATGLEVHVDVPEWLLWKSGFVIHVDA